VNKKEHAPLWRLRFRQQKLNRQRIEMVHDPSGHGLRVLPDVMVRGMTVCPRHAIR
jgi:hypothetical protein